LFLFALCVGGVRLLTIGAASARGLLRTFARNMETSAAKSALTVDIDSRGAFAACNSVLSWLLAATNADRRTGTHPVASQLYRTHERSFYQMPVDKVCA
jgi:hypothetical protein